MVSACHDVDVRLWDVAPWPSKSKCYGLIRHPDKVESVAVSPGDPFTVATSTWDGTIRLFRLAFDDCVDDRNATGTARPMVVSSRILGKGLPLTLVQFTQDGMHLQGVKGFRLRQWSVMQPKSQNDLSDNYGDGSEKDGKCETLSGRRANRIHHVTVSRQSHRIAYTESDGTLHISTLADAHYNAVVTKTMSTSRGDGSFCSNVNKITSSTFSNCGHFLFVACEDGTVQISMVP
jgi:WD40 repeat protein